MSAEKPPEDDFTGQKRAKMKLNSSTESSESDTETVGSFQGIADDTELADDLNPSSLSELPQFTNEYDISETDEEMLRFYFSDDSLEEEEVLPDMALKTIPTENIDIGLLGDASESNPTSPTSTSDVDPELPRNDYLDFEKCLLCRTERKDISYPYCSHCFTWKKKFFPDRPRPKDKLVTKNNKLQSDLSEGHNSNLQNKSNLADLDNKKTKNHSQCDGSGVGNVAQSEGPLQVPQPGTSNSTFTSEAELCRVCFSKPQDGLLLHSKTAHIYGCYSCAKEIWHRNGCCPLCRRKVYKVVKVFT